MVVRRIGKIAQQHMQSARFSPQLHAYIHAYIHTFKNYGGNLGVFFFALRVRQPFWNVTPISRKEKHFLRQIFILPRFHCLAKAVLNSFLVLFLYFPNAGITNVHSYTQKNLLKKNSNVGTRELIPWLRGNWTQVQFSALARWFTTICNSSSRACNILFMPPPALVHIWCT